MHVCTGGEAAHAAARPGAGTWSATRRKRSRGRAIRDVNAPSRATLENASSSAQRPTRTSAQRPRLGSLRCKAHMLTCYDSHAGAPPILSPSKGTCIPLQALLMHAHRGCKQCLSCGAPRSLMQVVHLPPTVPLQRGWASSQEEAGEQKQGV